MNFDSLQNKQLYKFTGPPENWVTAIKFMTWGLEEKYRDRWTHILPGDIFLMHSTSTSTKVKGATSAVIGFGVVGDNPTIKTGPLWLQELENHENRWPLLVPFSEVYLFSPFFEGHEVPEPTLENGPLISQISLDILKTSIPLSHLNGFPQMGSFSSVKPEVVAQILNEASYLYVIGSQSPAEYIPTPFIKLDNAKEQARYGTSLQTLDIVKRKTFSAKGSTYTKDPVLLERAENAHQITVEKLMDLFKSHGYETYFNKHVDLFATNGDRSFLFEVKSNENKNFLPQARKGIVQLFEYEYFEITKFQSENGVSGDTYKNLTFSQAPTNSEYAKFLNSIGLGISYFDDKELRAFGNSVGLSSL